VPRVSVLLPVRDAAPTLEACLGSLSAQTLADHEVVVVDDGSRDGGDTLLDALARQDPRLRVLHTPRLGLVPALNLALAAARAPLVARMDADDLALPERLALQAGRLESEAGLHVLGSRVEVFTEPGTEPGGGMRAYVEWQNALLDHQGIARDRYVESPLVHPSVMMRREALAGLGGWRAIDGPEDYDLWLRAFDAGWRFAKHEETLLRWRDHPGRLTRTDPRYAPERFRDLKIEALRRGPLRRGRGAVVWGAGPIGKAWARALAAAGTPVVAFVDVDPRKIGRSLQGAPVVAVASSASFRGALHLAAVGQRGARARIRAEAIRLGIGEDLIAVA
jgi:glycosyltransferase involved in cell wall biosynthesis